MSNIFPTRTFICTICGKEKDVIMNHDGLGEIYERCTDNCMWVNKEGPPLYSATGEKTGFRKVRMVKKVANTTKES